MKTAYSKSIQNSRRKSSKGCSDLKPDELAAETIYMMNELPDFDKTRIDVMVGNAMPEAEQGLNVGRLISLMGLKLKMFLE
jgi:acetyl-CoA acyltransferase